MTWAFKRTRRHAAAYNAIRDAGPQGIGRRDIGAKVFGKPGYKGLKLKSAWRTLDRDLARLVEIGLVFRREDVYVAACWTSPPAT